MSMHNYANWGHVVKVRDLLPLFSSKIQDKIEELLDDGEEEELAEVLGANLPAGLPPISSVFRLGDEAETEDLEYGVEYIFFDEEDLYVKRETPGMKALRKRGVVPKESRWVTCG